MKRTILFKLFFILYGVLWTLITPALYLFPRLREGYSERRGRQAPGTPPSDIWIQAASAGEAYLAREILKNLAPETRMAVHLTSYTSQGLDILKDAASSLCPKQITVTTGFFPFDSPAAVKHAVAAINPKVLVLLESEIWPGLIHTLKKKGKKVMIVNGRITDTSFRKYMIWPGIWQYIRPDRVLAISEPDAKRFSKLFHLTARALPNIKFDRMADGETPAPTQETGETGKFLVMASVRKEEEGQALTMMEKILKEMPGTTIGLFPRHMHRVKHWKRLLTRAGIPWALRSEIPAENPGETVILWDRFGELGDAYKKATAAFVGGSLVPLGGQNFMEPLSCGITPVIGPHWDHFSWAGGELFKQGLVIETKNQQEAANALVEILKHPREKQAVLQAAQSCFHKNRGGAKAACTAILTELQL